MDTISFRKEKVSSDTDFCAIEVEERRSSARVSSHLKVIVLFLGVGVESLLDVLDGWVGAISLGMLVSSFSLSIAKHLGIGNSEFNLDNSCSKSIG